MNGTLASTEYISVKNANVTYPLKVFNPHAREAASIQFKTEVNVKARLPLTEDYDRFEFTVKSWAPCSKSCGGGKCKLASNPKLARELIN